MERIAKVSIAILLSAILPVAESSWAAISITAAGFWSDTIDETDLVAGPGSNIIDTHESAADQVSLDVTGTIDPPDTWRVDVRRVDSTWHTNLHLHLKRTSDGGGPPGSISGGTSYQEVTDTYQSFFSGAGDHTGINVQLKMTGVSVAVPAATYSSTVYYTIVDN